MRREYKMANKQFIKEVKKMKRGNIAGRFHSNKNLTMN
jgi:hypothetical protein